MEKDENYKKYPRLRDDLKISKMVQSGKVTFVVKDPLKGEFFKFDQDEWQIIKLFDGKRTHQDMVEHYNQSHLQSEIDLDVIKDFQDNLEGMNILQKSSIDTNVMLIEKMKEMRQSQLLSKKGSLLYKRFPIVDPDKFFNRIIDRISFFWTKGFFIFSVLVMFGAVCIILANWTEFNTGVYNLFTFKEMSFINGLILWAVVYITIAIHELGHGLTCKYYGGEVHEIGFLFLFFQPCMYANVNDAWMFDKKWKQVLVTVAGGYIEFFIGACFAYVWALTNPNTFINLLSFQVMAICSVSTVLFNFNPLIKLDGYYLFSDFMEVPNLKDNSFKYLKFLSGKYIFGMPQSEEDEDEFLVASKKERTVMAGYGLASFFWMFGLLTGLVGMVHGMLVDKIHAWALVVTGWVAYKMMGGQIMSGGKFLIKWYMQHRSKFQEPRMRNSIIVGTVILLAITFYPAHYKIRGTVVLGPEFVRVVRSKVDGRIEKFYHNDGDTIVPGDKILALKNLTIDVDRKIASLEVDKLSIKYRRALLDNAAKAKNIKRELENKKMDLKDKIEKFEGLDLVYESEEKKRAVLTCADQIGITKSFIKTGDEICKLMGIEKVKALVQVSEQQVKFLRPYQQVSFKLPSNPTKTYEGIVGKIRQLSEADPRNPKNKMYTAEIIIDNDTQLKPGMEGIAKIYGHRIMFIKQLFIKLAYALRLDLFF